MSWQAADTVVRMTHFRLGASRYLSDGRSNRRVVSAKNLAPDDIPAVGRVNARPRHCPYAAPKALVKWAGSSGDAIGGFPIAHATS